MTQRLSHTNKHRTNWLCCATYQLPRQSEQPQRFLFVYGGTARCVSSTRTHIIVYYISVTRSLQQRTEVNDNKQQQRWCYWIIYLQLKSMRRHSSHAQTYFPPSWTCVFGGSCFMILLNEAHCKVLCLGTSQACVRPVQGVHMVTANRRCKSTRTWLVMCFPQLDSWFCSHYAELNEFFWAEKLEVRRSPRGLQQTLVLTL